MKGRIILVVDESEEGDVAVERLKFLGESGLKANIYILFCPKLPKLIPTNKGEFKMLLKLRVKANELIEGYIKNLEGNGFSIKFVDMFIGNLCKKVLELENLIKPDFIILGIKERSFLEKIFYGDPKKIIFKTKTPVIVCKKGYVRVECDEDALVCPRCYLNVCER